MKQALFFALAATFAAMLFFWHLRTGKTGARADRVMTAIPVALFLYCIVTLACNVPFWDDYDAILRYLSRPAAERLKTIFAFHNEHRIFMPRLFFEGVRLVFGQFNFTACILAGDMLLIIYVFLLGRRIAAATAWWYYLPCLWLFLDLANYENTLWALTAVQSHAVVLCAFLACLFFSKRRSPLCFIASLLCGFAATYTTGSGMAVWPCLALAALKDRLGRRRTGEESAAISGTAAVWRAVLFLAVAGASIGCYLNGFFENSAALKATYEPVQTTFAGAVLKMADFCVTFLGAVVPSRPLALLLGIPMAAVVFYILKNAAKVKDGVLFSFWLFLMATICAGAVFRGVNPPPGGGTAAAACRYGIVSISTVATSLAMVTALLKDGGPPKAWNALIRLFLYGACVVNLYALFHGYGKMSDRKHDLESGLADWPRETEGLKYPDQARASETLHRAQAAGVFTVTRAER